MKALVSHPGLQHAHQLARALEDAGHLTAFWSGIPVRDAREHWSDLGRVLSQRVRMVPVPSAKRRHLPLFPVLSRLGSNMLPARTAHLFNHRLDHLYDRYVARAVGHTGADLVVCYENAALHTFRAAKRAGAICVLDAASLHFHAAQRWRPQDPTWVDAQKKAELELADSVLACSELAAASYRDAGIPGDRVVAVPLGTDLPNLPDRVETAGGPLRVVFVGAFRQLKGADLLLEAIEAPECRGRVHLTIIGGRVESALESRAARLPSMLRLPFMPQRKLFEEIARHQVLVLPSRLDSFGMVVAESMAAGVPALVTDRVGAKCIIEKHPGSGWIVPCAAAALVSKLRELADNPETLVHASESARRAARDFTWESYRRRVVASLEQVYAAHRAGP